MATSPSSDSSQDDFPSERKGKIPARPQIGTALVETSTGAMKALQYVEAGDLPSSRATSLWGTVEEVQTVSPGP